MLEALNEIDNLGYSLTHEWLDYIIQETSESVFVAMEKENLVGIATCMINEMDNTNATINIAVHPQYRNRGVGSQLHNKVISYAKYKNIKAIEAYVKERLDSAGKFAEKRGFYPVLYAWQMDLVLGEKKFYETKTKWNNTVLTFRKATLRDNHTYAHIINQVFEDQLDHTVLGQLLKDPSVGVYMLEKEGKVIGSTTIQMRDKLSVGYIYDVAIMPQYRGQGFGSYMLRKCLGVLQDRNLAIVTLTVTGQNKDALALYHRLGFREVDVDIVLGRVPLS